jgi:hypothetical protein
MPAVRTFASVLCVYVLKLLPDELSLGRVVGEVEDVGSQSTARVRNVEELVWFLTERRHGEPGDR